MVAVPDHVFRGYDMRGMVGTEITPGLMRLVGQGFATYLWSREERRPEVIVGRDLRPSSAEMANGLIDGILSTGAHVVDVGEAPTPAINFSYHLLGGDGVAAITASHNPSEYNGAKLRHSPQRPICGAELQRLLALIKQGDFRTGTGAVTRAETVGDYIGAIARRVTPVDRLRVVVDPGNGSASQTAPQALRAIGCEVVELYCEPDGTFPNHHPDPVAPANLVDLQERVVASGADVGFSLDGDGDRLGLVDDRGRMIMPDTFLMALFRDELARRKGKIVIDVSSTETLAEDIRAHGGEVVRSKCGYPYLLEKLSLGRDYLLGGEVTGHIFFNEPDLDFDDGTYAACRIASYLAAQRVRMSDIVDDPALQRRVQTPQERVRTTDERKFEIVEALATQLAADPATRETDTTDGVKAYYGGGWVLTRASNTAPDIILRAEADSDEEAARLLRGVRARVEALVRASC